MFIPSGSKFLSEWKYTELARYVPSADRVLRETKYTLHDDKEVEAYALANNNIGIYTSVWRYNTSDIDTALRLGSLYFDIDEKDDLDRALSTCKTLVAYLCNFISYDNITVYFTGEKGFHVECEAYALGVQPSNDLPATFRYIASKIAKSLDIEFDFSVYDARRMWRLPGSIHQKTGLYKTILPQDILFSYSIDQIREYSSMAPAQFERNVHFEYSANEWYRSFIYEIDQEKRKAPEENFLDYFNKYGTKSLVDFGDVKRVFDKDNLFRKCPSFKKMTDQIKNTGELEHEARLFMCSILTYTDDAIEFLVETLSHASDFNLQKSNAHIQDWIRRRELGIGGRPFSCERANAAGVGCGNCNLEPKQKIVRIGDKHVKSGEYSSPSPIRYAYRIDQGTDQDKPF